jgi:hypothetical protein
MHILLAIAGIGIALAAIASPGGTDRLGRVAYWLGNLVALGLLVMAWQTYQSAYADSRVTGFFVVLAGGAWLIGVAIRYVLAGD